MSQRLALWAALVLIGLQGAFAANEAGFLELWKNHERDPSRHEDLVAQCRKFFEANPGDPLRDAAKSLEAWHLLAAGKDAEAWPIFEGQAGSQSAAKVRTLWPWEFSSTTVNRAASRGKLTRTGTVPRIFSASTTYSRGVKRPCSDSRTSPHESTAVQ